MIREYKAIATQGRTRHGHAALDVRTLRRPKMADNAPHDVDGGGGGRDRDHDENAGGDDRDVEMKGAMEMNEQAAGGQPDWSRLCLEPPSPSGTAAGGSAAGGGGNVGKATKNAATNAALRAMAKEYFSSPPPPSSSSSSSSLSRGKKKSAALSEMIASLEPVLGGSGGDSKKGGGGGGGGVTPKVRALCLLGGAIEGCSSSSATTATTSSTANADTADTADDNTEAAREGLTPAVMALLAKFLLSYCQPYRYDYTMINPDDLEEEEEEGGNGNGNGDNYDDNGNDIGENVRDAALGAVVVLLRCDRAHGEEGEYDEDEQEDKASTTGVGVEQSIMQRLRLARRAVEARCLSDDVTDYEHQYDSYGYGSSSGGSSGADRNGGEDDDDAAAAAAAALEGLATLPRARRSLCFAALDGAVTGSQNDITTGTGMRIQETSSVELKRDVASFVIFVSTCLHGETDPRCLLQMLRLLHRCQVVFLPLFGTESLAVPVKSGTADTTTSVATKDGMDVDDDNNDMKKNDQAFPAVSIFDSVAPYYPIKFTPPPNDPHGISREGLRDALMAILCTVDPGGSSGNGNDDKAAAGTNDTVTDADAATMTTLAARLFLERLLPPKSHDPYGDDMDYNDGAESTADKIEALNDLRDLLLPPGAAVAGSTFVEPMSTVGTVLIKELSSTVIKVHSDAVMDMPSASDAKERENYKVLLDTCCSLSSGIALRLEELGDPSSSHWTVFVLDTVRETASVLTTAPQGMKGRSSTAYLSSLAACGGIRTLRTCLDGCLPPLIGVLRGYGSDTEKAAAAALATGTMFSSSERSLSQAARDGVVIYPHPLQEYASDAVRILCDLGKEDKEISLRVAAVTGLGASLLAVPSSILAKDEITMIQQELVSLSTQISVNNEANGGASCSSVQYEYACSRVVGSALGRCLASKAEKESSIARAGCVLDDNEDTTSTISNQVFPAMIESAASPAGGEEEEEGDGSKRHDVIALASACEVGGQISSEQVVYGLLSSVLQKLRAEATKVEDTSAAQSGSEHPAVAPAKALSYVIRNGGDGPAVAFHETSSNNEASRDVIEALCTYKEKEGRNTTSRQVGMSKLVLPNEIEREDKDAAHQIDLAYKILPHIIPAYRNDAPVPVATLQRMIVSVSKVMPPLSQRDNVRVSVMLPLVAAILGNSRMQQSTRGDEIGASIFDQLEAMAVSVADYSLCYDWDPRARSSASSCLFLILLHYQRDKAKCIGPAILKDCISAVGQYIKGNCEEATGRSLESLRSSLDLCAVVVSHIYVSSLSPSAS